MEQKEERTLSSSVEGEGAVDEAAAASGSPTSTTTTTTTIPGEAVVVVNNDKATKVYTTAELEALSRSVFSNKLVSELFH